MLTPVGIEPLEGDTAAVVRDREPQQRLQPFDPEHPFTDELPAAGHEGPGVTSDVQRVTVSHDEPAVVAQRTHVSTVERPQPAQV